VTDATRLPPYVVLTYLSVSGSDTARLSPQQLTAPLVGDSYTFPNVQVRGLHNTDNELRFTPGGQSQVGALVVSKIATQSCAADERALAGTTLCLRCPDHGVCDGSSTVTPQSGFWRSASTSYTFYDCSAPYSADSCVKGGCATGYTGPRCSVCEPGFGHTGLQCTKCLSSAANWVLIALVGLALLGALYFLVVKSVDAGLGAENKKDAVPIIVKMLLNHMQVTAIVGLSNASIPSVLVTFFRGTQQASSFDPNLSFVTCEVTPTYASKFLLIATAPYALFALFTVVLTLRQFKALMAGQSTEAMENLPMFAAEVQRNRAQLVRDDVGEYAELDLSPERTMTTTIADEIKAQQLASLNEYDALEALEEDDDVAPGSTAPVNAAPFVKSGLQRVLDVAAVTLLVVLFLLFPSILQVSGDLLQCERLDYGDSPSRSVLIADRSIDCSSDSYATLRFWAYLHLVIYGIGVPIFAIAVVKMISVATMNGSMEDAKRLFYFATGGYRRSRWYWESIVLVRKAAVVAVAFAIQDVRVRVYAAMWVMAIAFTANALLRPYANVMLSALETASLLCIAVSLNLSLLFSYSDQTTNPGLYWGALLAIVAINAVMLAAFAAALVWSIHGKMRAAVLANPWRFAFLRRLFEDNVDSELTRLRKEVAATRRQLCDLLPRTVLLNEARRGVPSLRAEELRRSYETMLATLPLRLQHATVDADEVLRQMFELEREVLAAELRPKYAAPHVFD